ncbi:MAG TPA: hypothetical protein VD997_00995 [Phycisphaerales bacterium]|nr:hypothetical protein [Phycisphaerales bacterium]
MIPHPADSHATFQAPDPHAEVIAYLHNRSVPCPRCGYDLRDIQTATCPECGDELVLKIASARPHFAWLIVAMAPGCFSGVAAVFMMVPIIITHWHQLPPGDRMPPPGYAATAFGWLSVASVVLMYRRRHRIMAWTTRMQAAFAAGIWGVHVLMFVVTLAWLWMVT